MGHATGEPADRLHLLRLRELRFELPLSRDIPDECFIKLDVPGFVADRARAELHANASAILSFPRGFQLIVDLVGIRVLLDQAATLVGIRVHVARQVQREQFCW